MAAHRRFSWGGVAAMLCNPMTNRAARLCGDRLL
jgi:hypothetical protein